MQERSWLGKVEAFFLSLRVCRCVCTFVVKNKDIAQHKHKIMGYSSVLSEIAHDGKICMEPMTYHRLRNLMFSNIALGAKVEVEEKKHAEKVVIGEVVTQSQQTGQEGMVEERTKQQIIFPSDAYNAQKRAEFYGMLDEEDEVVNVITIAGPMTRGGGACSYGSIDHRDLIMEASNVPQVKAHILLTRTPGGMASTLRDYRMAINYAHARGQKVYMLCDGDVASGGAFTGTICDGIYAVNPDDEIGSLGMYCAFFTNKDGDKDAVTQETYHEYYASRSKDKNAWYRAAADDDMSLIAESIESDLEQLLVNVKADRPNVKKDQLTGKMYRMGDVKGSLIDGFTTLNQLALMALKEWNRRGGAVLPAKMGGVVKGRGVATESQQTQDKEPKVETPNNQEQMKNYPNLGKAAGLEDALELQADGYVSLSEEQADVMESAIEKATEVDEATKQALADAQAQVESLNAEKEQLAQQLAEATTKADELQNTLTAKEEELANAQSAAEQAAEEVKGAHETAMETLKAEHASALTEKQTQVEDLQKQLEEANASLASKDATIADLNTTIAELNESAGGKQNGGAPQSNGQGAAQPTYSMEGQYDHSLSPAENRKRIEEYNKKLAKMAAENKK